MSIEIREIKVIGKISKESRESNNLNRDQIIKLLNDNNNKLIDKCVTKVLKKIEKSNRR